MFKETGGAGEIGTKKLVRKYKSMTPGETVKIIKKLVAEKRVKYKRIHHRKHYGDDEVQGPGVNPRSALRSGKERADKNLKKTLPKDTEKELQQ